MARNTANVSFYCRGSKFTPWTVSVLIKRYNLKPVEL